ncbi:COP9 signalosome complex subunit 4 [Coemansia sp. RSA 1286]|nr:COP9 signalosome complex subunit 4 [Coemansia sp. RSA 1286]
MSSQVEQLAVEIANAFRSTDLSNPSSGNLEETAHSFIKSKLKQVAESDSESKQQLLTTTIDASLNTQVATAISTAIVKEIAAVVDEEKAIDVAGRKKVLRHILSRVQQRAMAYEDAIIMARKTMSNILASENHWEEAAQELREIRFDQMHSQVNNNEKFDVYLRIIEYYALAGNQDQAVLALNRATTVVQTVADVERIIRYRVIQARIYEKAHRYIEAANVYRIISQSDLKSKTDQERALSKAIECVVLAAAGPQKMRVMTNLYREKLASTLPSFGLLENMVLKRLIKPAELEEFSTQAKLTQETIGTLVQAVREHNVFVLSSLYTNIKFENLGRSLGIDADEAEQTCANMIAEGRMKGRIDQIDGVITFEGSHEVGEVAAAISMKRQVSTQAPPMHFRETVSAKWDLRIENLCQSIEDAVDLLIERQPVYAEALFNSVEQR